jgi:hypothetical protein
LSEPDRRYGGLWSHLLLPDEEAALNESILELVARVIEWCEPPRDDGPGHPPTETVRVLATLRRFLREGTQWGSLRATAAQASGSTLRRRLADWAQTGVL